MRRAAGIALAGVALTLTAFTFDASALFVPGVAFVLLGAVAGGWVEASARGASVRRALDAERVTEGEPLEATLEVGCNWLGLPGGEVVDPLAGAPVALSRTLSPIRGVRHATISVVTRFERRGLHRLQPPVLIVADRLGLARSMHTGSSEARHVLVLPRISPVQWREPTRAGRSPRTAGRAAPEPHGAFDVDGLRPYRPGTPASRIYWPALAKGAGLLERSLQADSELRPLVILDARGTADDAEPLDAAVRAAASLTVALARIGGCALLLPGERRASEIDSDLGGWSGAHARLALVEGGPDAPPPRLTARSQVGALVYVATRPRERLLARLGAAGAAACVLVLPTQCTQRMVGAASFEVAGCYGFVLRAGSGRASTGLRPARERVA